MTEIQEAGWAGLSKNGKALNLKTDDGKHYTIALARVDKVRSGEIKGARFSTFVPSKSDK